MLRICRQCAKQYEGKPSSTLCPDCAAASRKNVVRDRTCRTCGITFPGGPRAWYCPTCRRERRRAMDREAKRSGPARTLGSTDICTVCGDQYTVNSGRQRYCPACAPDAVKAIDRAQGLEWYAANSDPDQRRAQRQAGAAPITCVICSKAFTPRDSSLTCSPSCSRELSRRHNQRYEREHREERNAYHRERLKKTKGEDL
ncbi:MAG: hypothetical protein IJW45_00370 [Oscillospiraceae bacterium]|nr:hypothetical protein [Oscillospiraceae bacterium]